MGRAFEAINIAVAKTKESAPRDLLISLIRKDPDALVLLVFLRLTTPPTGHFLVNGHVANNMMWTNRRLADARDRLVELGLLDIAPANGPIKRYRWPG
ncbi:MAG TPA: hypothetical protein VH684_03460 [Xanthobacteraceae bacterium]